MVIGLGAAQYSGLSVDVGSVARHSAKPHRALTALQCAAIAKHYRAGTPDRVIGDGQGASVKIAKAAGDFDAITLFNTRAACSSIGRKMFRFVALLLVAVASLLPASSQALTGEAGCLENPTRSCVSDLLVQSIMEIEDRPTRYSFLEDLIQDEIDSVTVGQAVMLARRIEDPVVRLRAIELLNYLFSRESSPVPSDIGLLTDEVASVEAQLRILNEQADSISATALESVGRGSISLAVSEAASIELAGRRAETLTEIGVAAYEVGDNSSGAVAFAGAWQAVGELVHLRVETRVLLPLIRSHFGYGDGRHIVAHALSIPFLENRAIALMFVAGEQFDLGYETDALDTLNLARESLADNLGPSVLGHARADLLREVARLQERFGDQAAHDESAAIARQIRFTELELFEPILSSLPVSLDSAQSALGLALTFEDPGLRALALWILVYQIPADRLR